MEIVYEILKQGLVYSFVALGIFLTFKIIDFPDIGVNSTFTLGAASSTVMLLNYGSPSFSLLIAFIVGFIAGLFNAILHVYGEIKTLLSGIITMIALYSINFRIMGRPNIPLIEVPTIFLNLNDLQIIYVLFGMITITVIILFFIFSSEIGLAIRAGRRNYMLAESYGMSKSFIILSTLGLSNALVSLAGGLIAQMQGFVDINMGNGILIVGLISIILGQKIYHFKNLCCNFIMCIIGALIYKSATVVAIFALDFGFMSSDIYLLSAIIMIIITVKIKKNIT